MKHMKSQPIKIWFEDLVEKIENKLASIITNFDENRAQSEAFRAGEYCNERKAFLHEIRVLKALLCIDLICTLCFAIMMLGR